MTEQFHALGVPADKEPLGNEWHKVDPGNLGVDEVSAIVVGDRAICLVRTPDGYRALDNRCPHQGGPLGEGHIEDGWVICPWHGFEYDPTTGAPPEGYGDFATTYPLEERGGAVFIELPTYTYRPTLMDQMVDVMTDWGVDTVFGMVGHSNLGLADALRRSEENGKLRYFGIRHEGAGAFAASAYGKLTGRPAACFSIAGPGATNLLTGLWDAKVDRVPILALTGQVQSQVLGPGAFQEIPTAEAFSAVAEWSQTVVSSENASELMALAVKHAIVKRDVAHIVLPDEMQERPGLDDPPPRPRMGRVSETGISPQPSELQRALELLSKAERPVLVVGNGARPFRDKIVRFAERHDLPVITTFKAKGLIADDHPLGCGVLGRSGTPVASSMMGRSDTLVVLGASFSNHTGISKKKPTIQVDFDRMMLGKFHPVDVPLWGEIEQTLSLLDAKMEPSESPGVRAEIADRKQRWRTEKERRAGWLDRKGAMHPAFLFEVLGRLAPEDAVLPVDVGNNTYAFGHYFECKAYQDVIMSGYLGSIGFALPAALGAWAACGDSRKVISISGDGGLGQYLADFTTAVKYAMPITHIVLNNDELAKISREQVGGLRPVWETSLVNPDFAAYAELCGGAGFRADRPEDVEQAVGAALAVRSGLSLVEVRVSPRWV